MSNYDVIVFVEVNITQEEKTLYSIPNFNNELLCRENRKGGGISIYIRSKYEYEIVKPDAVSFESLMVKLKGNEIDLNIFAIYRPPNNNTMDFCNELEIILNTLPKKSNIAVVGDMNIDILKDSLLISEYLDALAAMGLTNCNPTEITREDLSRGCSSNIDHLFVRQTY